MVDYHTWYVRVIMSSIDLITPIRSKHYYSSLQGFRTKLGTTLKNIRGEMSASNDI